MRVEYSFHTLFNLVCECPTLNIYLQKSCRVLIEVLEWKNFYKVYFKETMDDELIPAFPTLQA